VIGGSGADMITSTGNYDSVIGGSGPDTITVFGQGDSITGAGGADSITVFGNYDTVAAGSGSDTVSLFGSGETFKAGTATNDTVVGFSQSSGDTIKLASGDTSSYAVAHAAPQNGGTDTLITLNDGSTILLKGVGHIDSSFFS